MIQAKTVRVAIYTRKSVSEGLDQEFNSLEAQREAVEAYVRSQRGEGWAALPERYDDGGHTGANTNRPAFQRLIRDIEAGRVDVIAVYKIDRLSRSLADFARLMELFERHAVSFVSVTQQFNSASSMGRLTLNILMSFAEFERQTIAERTRDKIVASRRRGLWTGGRPVLGYDVVEKRLVVNEKEAERVQQIFRLYLELGSLLAVVDELKRRGWTTKTWTNKQGALVRGRPVTKTSLHHMLRNPLYAGKVRCDGEVHEGAHEAIVDQGTWQAVQAALRSNAGGSRAVRESSSALLQGIARCACGAALAHHYTAKGNKRYAYYVCSRQQKEGAAACPGSRVAAGELESFVLDRIRDIGRDPSLLEATLESDRREREARRPEMEGEVRRLTAERTRLDAERRNVVDAVAQGNGSVSRVLLERVAELGGAIADIDVRLHRTRDELEALELGTIQADQLHTALAEFDPIWNELFMKERRRVLALLLERVELDAAHGEIEIEFRPGRWNR